MSFTNQDPYSKSFIYLGYSHCYFQMSLISLLVSKEAFELQGTESILSSEENRRLSVRLDGSHTSAV
jgi:hypothetical protein